METKRVGNEIIAAVKYGYEVAQSKQFSLEDVKKAFIAGMGFIAVDPNRYEEDANNYIQSLSTQQLPVGFIPEPNDIGFIKNADIMVGKKLYDKIMSPFKTITNSDGKEELVGNYVY